MSSSTFGALTNSLRDCFALVVCCQLVNIIKDKFYRPLTLQSPPALIIERTPGELDEHVL